jgi:hypothetical protein
MKWHESQNLKSKSVAEYVSKFITKKQNARVYKFVKMINSRIGYDPSSKFRHVSDHLFKKNIKEIKSEFKWEEEFESADLKYDLIYAELPINLRTDEKFVFDEKIKVGFEYNHLAKCLMKLNEDGRLFTLFTSSIFWSVKQRRIIEAIEEKGYYYDSGILCDGLWDSLSSINLYLVSFTKKKNDKIFVAKLKEDSIDSLYKNFNNNKSEDIEQGGWIDKYSFSSYDTSLLEKQIKNTGDYSGFTQKRIQEISLEIKYCKYKENLSDSENSIFIPKSGYAKVITKLKETKTKHHNLYKISFDQKQIISEYAKYFLNTDIGKMYRKSLLRGSSIPHIPLSELKKLAIFLPDIKKQKELIEISSYLNKVISEMEDLKKNLSYYPKKSKEIFKTSKSYFNKLSEITKEDKIKKIIQGGETKTIEFKETFSFNKHTNEKRADYLIKSSCKNIVGFINTNGGKLFIGVNDNAQIIGIEEELLKYKSVDAFKLFLSDTIKNKIGPLFNTNIDFKIHEIDDKKIVLIECKKSEDKECFYEGKEFYIRQNPKAQLLEGTELILYIKSRFS